MKGKVNLLGHEVSIQPKGTSTIPAGALNKLKVQGPTPGIIDKEKILEGIKTLKEYKDGKKNLESRIVENEKWYRLRHWEVIRNAQDKTAPEPEPASAWLLNSLANKHADAMDNYPDANVLPRQKDDESEAQSLSDVIPLVMEKNDFEQTYSDAWWYKLKHGTAVYGEFWNTELENGLGDIDIKRIDILNLFWQPGITNIQKSRNIFLVNLIDDDILEAEYPFLAGKLQNKVIEVAKYVHDDTVDINNKSLVVDWYYRKKIDGIWTLQLITFVGENLIYASENENEWKTRGIYDHGEYPFDFDVLFPEEGTPVGFGYIDVMKSPQMYIDKLNQIISKNALMSGTKRWFIKGDGEINEQEFADWSKTFVRVTGNLSEENLREIDVKPLDQFIVQHLQNKIDELKETSGNRDFGQGGTAGGVTAAAAIAALQEAGNKLSRDMIKGSYRVVTRIVYKCIELDRQFYDEVRHFRIEGADGKYQFIPYDNSKLKLQQLPKVEGEDMMPDPNMPGSMIENPKYQPKFRKPVFDIKIKPQRSNPFSRMAQNELAKELYGKGFFDATRADQALIALELMDFEGKEKIVEKVSQNQTLLNQVMMLQQQLVQMATKIFQLTGEMVLDPAMMQPPGQAQQSGGQMQTGGQMPGASYTQKIAGRAMPNMNAGGKASGQG